MDTGSTYPERFIELGGVDVLGWTAHASWPTRAAVHAGKVLEGVAAEEHYWVLWLRLADGQKMKLVAGGLVAAKVL